VPTWLKVTLFPPLKDPRHGGRTETLPGGAFACSEALTTCKLKLGVGYAVGMML